MKGSLRLAIHIAKKNNTEMAILLHVNLRRSVPNAKLKMAGVPTQFGIDEKEIPTVISTVKTMPNLKLQGFHFHAMSRILSFFCYKKETLA